jgi:hypothetical protein
MLQGRNRMMQWRLLMLVARLYALCDSLCRWPCVLFERILEFCWHHCKSIHHILVSHTPHETELCCAPTVANRASLHSCNAPLISHC